MDFSSNHLDNNNWEKDYKEHLLSLWHRFDIFCKNNNLVYYAAYGTLIGAARHGGFIPWDDDIDLFMKRKDYDKLISLFHNQSVEGMELLSWHNGSYHLPFIKVCDKDSTICPFSSLSVIMGLFIDILPLDYINGPVWYCVFKSKVYRGLISVYTKIKKTNFLNKMLKKAVFYGIKALEWNPRNRGYLVSSCGPYLEKEVMKSSFFSDVITLPFENVLIPAPVDYKQCLSRIYGEWTVLPPIEKRVSNHDIYYLNLSKRLTKEEIQKEMSMEKPSGIFLRKVVEWNPYR